MNTGLYKEKIAICDKIENEDNQGGAIVTPANIMTVWASVLPFNSNQALQYNQVTTAQGYNIEFRALKTLQLTTRHGIVWKDKLMIIHSCDTITDPIRTKIIAFEQ